MAPHPTYIVVKRGHANTYPTVEVLYVGPSQNKSQELAKENSGEFKASMSAKRPLKDKYSCILEVWSEGEMITRSIYNSNGDVYREQ